MIDDQSNDSSFAETTHKQAVTAHDIRNELQTILASVDLFAECPGNEDTSVCQSMVNIRNATERALDLANGLLTSARAEHYRPKETLSVFQIGVRASEITERMKAIADKNKNKITVEIDTFDSLLTGNSSLVDTIVQNLLSNANKFTQNGTITLRISEDITPDNLHCLVTLSVEDTGKGIAEEDLHRLFKPYESRAASNSDASGFGIGTYAVAEAVRAMGGDIEVDTELGRGSRFTTTFSLPLAEKADGKRLHETEMDLHDPRTRKPRILVVDDNQVNLDLFVKALSAEAETVTSATSGDAALACVRTADIAYDLVLTDLNMPETDGLALAIELIRSEASKRPLVAALTAESDDSCLEACKAIGMLDLILKPVRPHVLRNRIRNILDTAERTRAATSWLVLDTSVTNELNEEFGQEATNKMMRRALEEAERLHSSLTENNGKSPDRNEIHSAVGSAGMTGLSQLDHALRIVQAVSKVRSVESAAFSAALGLLNDAIKTADQVLK